MEVIKFLNIENNVVFSGLISYEELPKYLTNATILALARPTSLQNETGFPSKLTEYLATKKPVIITRVSDIPKYFTNNVNAFVAEPGNVIDFADKLILALKNRELSEFVGKNGYQLVETIFNYNYQTKELVKILQQYSK